MITPFGILSLEGCQTLESEFAIPDYVAQNRSPLCSGVHRARWICATPSPRPRTHFAQVSSVLQVLMAPAEVVGVTVSLGGLPRESGCHRR